MQRNRHPPLSFMEEVAGHPKGQVGVPLEPPFRGGGVEVRAISLCNLASVMTSVRSLCVLPRHCVCCPSSCSLLLVFCGRECSFSSFCLSLLSPPTRVSLSVRNYNRPSEIAACPKLERVPYVVLSSLFFVDQKSQSRARQIAVQQATSIQWHTPIPTRCDTKPSRL